MQSVRQQSQIELVNLPALRRELEAARERVQELEQQLQRSVRKVIEDLGLTVRDLAAQMELSPAYVTDSKLGRRRITEDFLDKLQQVQAETKKRPARA